MLGHVMVKNAAMNLYCARFTIGAIPSLGLIKWRNSSGCRKLSLKASIIPQRSNPSIVNMTKMEQHNRMEPHVLLPTLIGVLCATETVVEMTTTALAHLCATFIIACAHPAANKV
jgi:hypothetical protein